MSIFMRPPIGHGGYMAGCWDWWGYTGPGYRQIRAVRAMLDRLAQPR
jgi:hypothetical protein